MPATRRLRRAKRFPLEQLGFTGSRDSKDPTAAGPRKLYMAKNCYPEAPEIGSAMLGRPGLYLLGAQLANAQLQWVGQFKKQDSTFDKTIAICGGEIYSYDWGGNAWTKVLDAATITAAGATLSATVAVYALNHANALFFHDGVASAFQWSGLTGGGISYMGTGGTHGGDDWPVAVGPLVEYYAKAFGVKKDSPTIFWTEENSEQHITTNAWDLIQTDSQALTGLGATNEALYYFRERSIGMVSGAVNTDFQSSGTQEAISGTIGTRSPGSVRVYDTAIHFIDSDGRPRRIVAGAGLQDVDISLDALETAKAIPAGDLGTAQSAIWSPGRLTLHAFAADHANVHSGLGVDTMYALTKAGEFVGLWTITGWTWDVLGNVKNASNQPLVAFGNRTGYVYVLDLPTGTHWSDAPGSVAISHDLEGGPLGFDTEEDKGFDLLIISVRLQGSSNLTGCSLYLTTPNGVVGPISLPNLTYADTEEKRMVVGIDAFGRWGRPRIVHATASERFAVLGWRAEAYSRGRDPRAA